MASVVHSGVKPFMCLCQSSDQVCDAGLCGGRLAGSIWLIAPPWQWATLINGRPELFVCVCVFYIVCCVWGPRCRISMWEHEATAVTLTSAAVAEKWVFTLVAEVILFALLLHCYSHRGNIWTSEAFLFYKFMCTVHVMQNCLFLSIMHSPHDE